jgi:hypothetical protein
VTKKLAVLFLMAILIVALATALGCGKKAEEGTNAAPTTETATNATPTPAPADTTVTTTADTTIKK